jgi:large subunit ribosomal protein L13
MRTFSAKPGEIERRWFIVDTEGKTLGRAAAEIAKILQGKNKPTYTPHVDTGDFVVVVNASRVRLTGRKLDDKQYHRHTGWVGHLVSVSARELLEKKPEELFRLAVRGMLPKTRLGRAMIKKLKIHSGPAPAHGYAAQKATALAL